MWLVSIGGPISFGVESLMTVVISTFDAKLFPANGPRCQWYPPRFSVATTAELIKSSAVRPDRACTQNPEREKYRRYHHREDFQPRCKANEQVARSDASARVDDLTSNQSFGAWGEVFGDRIAVAGTLDRVLHHAITINIRSHSYRIKEKLKAGLVCIIEEAAPAT